MSRIAYALLLAVAAFLINPTGASALSGSERACLDSGGTYVKDGANSICIGPEEPVANPNANPNNNSQTTQTTTTGHGNTGNKTQESCSGPPGQCN